MVFLCTALLCLLAAWTCSRLVLSEDARSLMPDSPPELARSFALLQKAPFMQRVTISVGGQDPAALADTLAEALKGPEFKQILTGPPGDGKNPLDALTEQLPTLLDREDLESLDLSPAAIPAALEQTKKLLLSPAGPACRLSAALDPLNLRLLALKKFADPELRRYRLDGGHILSPDGGRALILAEPHAPMSDSASAAKVMARVEEAARTLPAGTELLVAGGHRHSAANATAIKGDLERVLPVSFVLLAVIFIWGIRSIHCLTALAVPSLALLFACSGMALLYGGVSGIVIGFGAVLLGISADYALYVFFASQGPGGVLSGLNAVCKPLLMSAFTALAAFAALMTSGIPTIAGTAIFSIIGLLCALALALVVLPLLFRPVAASASAPSPVPVPLRPVRTTKSLLPLWPCVLGAILLLGAGVTIDGDIRNLGYSTPQIRKDEENLRRIWGDNANRAMLAAQGEDFAAALEKNDAIWRILHDPALGTPPEYALSLAPMMPSEKTREERRQSWVAFWQARSQSTLTLLEDAARELGFAKEAFAPFAASLLTPPGNTRPPAFTGMLTAMLCAADAAGACMYTMLPEHFVPSPSMQESLEAAGAVRLSTSGFREELSAAISGDVKRFGLCSLLVLTVTAILLVRSPARAALALLPPAAALCAVLAVFRLSGMPMNLFHIAALPLVMGLAVNYGIFVVFALGGAQEPLTRKAVLLCALTSCAGFGSLFLARHPALFSIGLTVLVGLGTACAVALWGIPRLVAKGEE